jgi:CDP-glucose 4,6-dehydratase
VSQRPRAVAATLGSVTGDSNLMFDGVYNGRRVLVTGNTGFKGSWLTLWLLDLGATVAGYSLGVPTEPSNFVASGLRERIRHVDGDVRDRDRLARALDDFQPDCVFHLAAQALVRRSYADPITTFETNAFGTLNLLEALRTRPSVRAAVLITSDKSYRNVEWPWGYRETDTLGGEDPYSGSKACAELIAHSYHHSFFRSRSDLARIATTRAGNVIGGGDWAQDRIVPDAVRAWSSGATLTVRHPRATRPWQHVLEPLSGYLRLGQQLLAHDARVVGEAYNFGPDATVNEPVEALLGLMARAWPSAEWRVDESTRNAQPESTLLKLSCDKALAHLGWRAALSFPDAVGMTIDWYRRFYESPGAGMFAFSSEQVRAYSARACAAGLPWAAA